MTPLVKLDEWSVAGRFPLGEIVATLGAVQEIAPDDVFRALARHAQGDWGECDAEDAESNDRALCWNEGRIFSAYDSRKGERFWIITEADRSVTTVLLPAEY